MALDSRYVTTINLEPYFVNKDTGTPLAGGYVYFFKDDDRTEGKLVYQLVQDVITGNYSYTPLPNPIQLSGVGTFQNAGGDNIAVYFYPFDEFGNEELYYIRVTDSGFNEQFTREAWPFPNSAGGSGGGSSLIGLSNQLTNPQFANVLFIPGSTLTITLVGAATTEVAIAPGWVLSVTHTGNTTIDVTQTPVVGQTALPNNPPFTLDLSPGLSITAISLIQTLENNPDWAAPQVNGVMGYLSASILLGDGTSANIQYVPSAGNAAQTLLNEANATGAYAQYSNTVQLEAANNPQTGATGSDQIVINILNVGATSSISNVQVIPLTTNTSGVGYDQTPVNRQRDFMFNYYNPLLQAKPIASYLEGWDFPLNPAQFLGKTVAASAIGANASKYVWDQTIVFQSADSGVGVTQSSTGALVLTAALETRMAIIQYQEGLKARELLNSRLASMVRAFAGADVTATISLWYTDNVSLPDVATGTNESLVTALDANGKPTVVAGWVEVPRSNLGDATFTIGTSATTNFNEYGFAGWDLEGIAAIGTATFFAIVVGTGTVAAANTVSIESVSLVPGDIPTRPAAQSLTDVVQELQYYYRKSFPLDTVPATNAGLNGVSEGAQITGASQPNSQGSVVGWSVPMRAVPTVVIYNPEAANNEIRGVGQGADWSATTTAFLSVRGFSGRGTTPAGSSAGLSCAIHWTADARLGIV